MMQNMHREDVKSQIRKLGKTLCQISISAGLSGNTVCISLKKPIPRANHAVAKFLNTTVHDIWPLWYDASGNRIYKHSLSSNSIKKAPQCHCQKSAEKPTGADV